MIKNLAVGTNKYRNTNKEVIFSNLFFFNKKILQIKIDIKPIQMGKITTLYL